jgi:hypothetical protein
MNLCNLDVLYANGLELVKEIILNTQNILFIRRSV